MGGVCIFVRKGQCFNKIDILHCHVKQNLDIFAVHLETKICNLIILSLYRASPGDPDQFKRSLNAALNYLYKRKFEFLICNGINIDYLNEDSCKTNSLLTTYNLTHIVNFPAKFSMTEIEYLMLF
jgi:hypothetical protein